MNENKYMWGIIAKPSGNGFTNFLFQASNPSIEADNATAKDSNGNTQWSHYYDHRLTISIDAKLPKSAGVPVQGTKIQISGIVMPTVSAGNVTGTFSVNSSTGTTEWFEVNGTPSITQSNSDMVSCSFTAVKYLHASESSS